MTFVSYLQFYDNVQTITISPLFIPLYYRVPMRFFDTDLVSQTLPLTLSTPTRVRIDTSRNAQYN